MKQFDQPSWIFVSHSSDDIKQVRLVRNHLEETGGSPLLFHLVAVTDPDEFWPLIRREIEARNFFLYCESASAERREWVQRERAAVDEVRRRRPVRIGSINVESEEIDFGQLDDFLAKTRVFPSFSHRDRETVEPFLIELSRAGFQVFSDKDDITFCEDWQTQIMRELEEAAKSGWVVAFLSSFSVQRPNIMMEIGAAKALGAKFLAVMIEKIDLPSDLMTTQVFDATRNPATAPAELARLLLTRGP